MRPPQTGHLGSVVGAEPQLSDMYFYLPFYHNGAAVAEQVQLGTKKFTDENLIKKIAKDLDLPADCRLSYIGEYSDSSYALEKLTSKDNNDACAFADKFRCAAGTGQGL